MAQVALHCLDIVPGADGGHGVGVPQIMEADFRAADRGHNGLERPLNGVNVQVPPCLGGEHKPAVLPHGAQLQSLFRLHRPLVLQELHHPGGGSDGSALVVFERHKHIGATLLLLPLELLVDQDGAPLEVHAVPAQPQGLPLAQTCKQGEGEQGLQRVALDDGKERFHLRLVQGLDFRLFHAGQYASVGGVGVDITDGNGLLERPVEHAVDIPQRLGGEALAAFLGGLYELVVNPLDGVGVQSFQLHNAQGGLDVVPDVGGVVRDGIGLHPAQEIGAPYVHPGAHGHFAGGGVGAGVQGGGGRFQLLRDLLLGLARDRTLNLFSGAGVKAHGIAGLPVGVFLSVAGDGLLAYGAQAVGGFAVCFLFARH